jgi:hypothetical protein
MTQLNPLQTALFKLADKHHRTLTGSKLHDPEKEARFWHCECLTCKAATKALLDEGYTIDILDHLVIDQ